tara:strand:- start:775 stop:945 length:171 start_codon:yes stop_codon:yes gene_type:complete
MLYHPAKNETSIFLKKEIFHLETIFHLEKIFHLENKKKIEVLFSMNNSSYNFYKFN